MDWAQGEANIPFPLTIKLRDTGRYGFLLPPEQILPTSEEIWAFHKAVADIVMDRYTRNQNGAGF